MSAVRGIGFDLDHTLAIDNRLERVAFLRLLEVVLDEGGQTIGTLTDEVESIDALLARQRGGAFTIDEAVRHFVAQHSVEPADRHVETFRRYAVDMVGTFVVALPGVRSTLAALHERGIAVAILSNGWNPLQRRKAEQVGFRGPILVSDEIGAQKPAARAFECLLQTLESDAPETWYVGDDPECDVAGAQAAGLQGIWLDWERKAYPQQLRAPDRTITGLRQLIELSPSAVRAT